MIVPLKSPLSGVAADRFVSVARSLGRANGSLSEADWRRFLEQELAWCRKNALLNGSQSAYEASARVLLDLARLGWQVREEGYGVELVAPSPMLGRLTPEQILEEKRKTRAIFQPLVEAQFRNPSVAAFIKRMENQSPSSGKKPVQALIADGAEIHARIRDGGKEAIQPYLQLVEADARDEFTGHSIREIWRYFRYSWSIPQFATPGRQLLYLVRDAAHPCHAVMGIIGLNNCALQMGTERETHLGWNFDAVCGRLRTIAAKDAPRLLDEWRWMQQQIKSALADVEIESLVTEVEISDPSDAVIARLRRRAREFDALRDETLRDFASTRSGAELCGMVAESEDSNYAQPPVSDDVLGLEEKPSTKPAMQKARRHLVARKRASLLAELLHARMILRRNQAALTDPKQLDGCLADGEVKVAINTVLAALKSRFAGVNMLEISTCGAIPPYNHLLGGKLAALLLFSPSIAADYRRIYGGASIIASQIKNQPVRRANELVYLGTTSLYAQGSSQYERLRLPPGLIADDQPELRFQCIGRTSGYGTLQFPAETRKAVEDHLVAVQQFQDVNSIFGEGPSPKLRKLVAGLRTIGFPPDSLMRHNRPRLIYSAALCPQAFDYLNARPCNLPSYIREPQRFLDATEKIVNFWKSRWLDNRLRHEPAMVALLSAKPWQLGDRIPSDTETLSTPATRPHTPAANLGSTLWHALAASGRQVTSDALSRDELDLLHVELPVEQFIREKVEAGFSVFLTGNAGDGKTHLLRRLSATLSACGAEVIEDASAVMRKGTRGQGEVGPLLDRWKTAVAQGSPFCVAINEYPLYLLIQKAREYLPDQAAELERQIRSRVVYGESSGDEDARGNLLVIDLSLRNPLRTSFASKCLERILQDAELRALANSDPALRHNLDRLSDSLVQERIFVLFERIADAGCRATVRELWIVLARIILGYRGDLTARLGEGTSHWYSEALFQKDGRFALFTELSSTCDPSLLSHPVFDAMLDEASPALIAGWKLGTPRPSAVARPERKEFCAIKRAFYFEHQSGNEIFSQENEESLQFRKLLRESQDNDPVALRRLVAAINRAFCPVAFSGMDENLYLWNGHRFHEQTSRSYIAAHRIPVDRLRLLKPRLPSRIAAAFPEYQPDHLILAIDDKVQAPLSIDAELFKTLCKLGLGLPRKLIEEGELFRIEGFIDSLSGEISTSRSPRQLLSCDLSRREIIEIDLSEDQRRYERVVSRTSK